MSQTPLSVSKSLTRRNYIKEKIDDNQDELLNPVNFGSIEDDKKLADWVSENNLHELPVDDQGRVRALATRLGVR